MFEILETTTLTLDYVENAGDWSWCNVTLYSFMVRAQHYNGEGDEIIALRVQKEFGTEKGTKNRYHREIGKFCKSGITITSG